MFCISCGHEIPEDSEFCSECGAQIQEITDDAEGFCTECGIKLPADSAFCTDCGAKIIVLEDERFCTECGQKLEVDSDFCSGCGAKTKIIDEIEELTDHLNEDVHEDVFVEEIQEIDEPEIMPVDPTPPPTEIPLWEQEALSEIALEEPEPEEIDIKEITKQRKLVMGLFGVTVTLLVAVIGLVVFIALNRGGEGGIGGGRGSSQYEYDPTAGMTPEEYHIHRIYTGNLPAHPNVNIGPAMENFYTIHPVWNSWPDGASFYVDVFADALVGGETATVQFIFRFSEDSTIFAPVHLLINGDFQDVELMHEMLNNIMLGIR